MTKRNTESLDSQHTSPKEGSRTVKSTRSPNFLAISLREAVAKVQLIYKHEYNHPANREVLARDMGYGGLNGASTAIISALSKYGLLEATGGDQHKLSPLAMDIVLHRPGDAERAQAIRKAAFIPSLYSELRATYGDRADRLPSNHTIEAYLVKRGYNPRTVSSAVRDYRATLEFVNEEASGFLEETAEDLVDEQAEESDREQQPNTSLNPGTGTVKAPEVVLQFKVSIDCEVRVEFSGYVTQEAIQKLVQLLDLSKDVFPKKDQPQVLIAEQTGLS